jgi:trimeric autotransporter adhesin
MKHVTFHLPSFLRRVRIHGGEFDSSARAMNREEQVRLLQADLRIVRGSTIERKQMSTTIKRVALVAVAALGLGVLSVAPSNAANQMDTLVLSSATGTQETTDTATAGSATATLSFLASAAGDSMSVTASLVSFPAGNTKLPVFDLVETTTGTLASPTLGSAVSGLAGAQTGLVQHVSATAAGSISAKYKVYMDAPSVVGTYVVRLTPAVVAGGGTLNATAQTLTITVTQKAAASTTVDATTSTSILNAGETITATADVAGVTGSMTLPTSNNVAAATISVTLKNTAGTTLTTSESYTAIVVSGPGLLGSGAQSTNHSFSAAGRAILVKAGDVVGVFPDGSSGVSKIEVRTAAGVVIGTETVTFFGAAAKVVATVKKSTIGGTTAVADVLSVVVTDAAGTSVSNLTTIGVVSSDTTKIASNYSSTATYSTTTGAYLVPVTPVAAGSANLTVTTKASATATTGVDAAAAVAVRVGSATPASITVALDKASYAPGEAVKATITVLDATGLAVADGVYNNIFATGGISANYTITSWSDTTTVTVADGVGTRTGFMPSTEGEVTFKWTTGTNLATANQAVAGTPIVVSVSSPAAAAATDAANEATDAANAATDAALAAAEAADAATSAAQEASDAVAALSESVTKLIAGLQAQIKSLAAVVAKIAKKVKA